MKIQNKVMVVTGGGNGIGRELVLNLLSRGARVAAVDINTSALAETGELSGAKKDALTTHTVNITERKAVEALADHIIAQHGTVDGLINCAGVIQPFVRLKDLEYEAIERVMNVNFFGTLHMIKVFLPHLLTRPEAHITNISSMGGFMPFPGQTIYGASKAAVKTLTECLQSELMNTNVRVTVVFPGAVGTNIMSNSGVAMCEKMASAQQTLQRLMLTPSKAAQIIVDGIERDRHRILVGIDSVFMDFMYRLNPRRATRFIFHQMKSMLPA